MKAITSHVYGMLTLAGWLNFYVIANGDALTVVDTGLNTASIDALQTALHKKGWKMEQIRHILITHAHVDHIGGLAELQRRCQARTYVHRLDAAIVRGIQPPIFAQPQELGVFNRMMLRASSNQNVEPARVDVELQDGDALDEISPGLRVVHLPGHSYGQCGFWFSQDQLLIAGDVALRMPWGYTYPLHAFSPDWQTVKVSVRKVVDLQPRILCIGHGAVQQGDIAAQLQHLL